MKPLMFSFALVAGLLIAAPAQAQCPVVTYYAPAPVVAGPVYSSYYAPTAYYRPPAYYPPVVTYRSTTAYYAPPVVAGRPVVGFYSPYGGPEIRVPGQPVRNLLRTIIP